jgi:hypothetical protein
MQAFCTSFVLAKWSGFLCSDFLIPFSSPFLKSYIFMMAHIPLKVGMNISFFELLLKVDPLSAISFPGYDI